MNLAYYWKIFKDNGHPQHFLLILLGLALAIPNLIGLIKSNNILIGLFYFGWGAFGIFIITEVFKRLIKKEQQKLVIAPSPNTAPESALLSPTPTTTSPIPRKKFFWDYFTLTLLIINIIVAIIISPKAEGWGLIFLFLYYALIATSIPFVTFSLMGKFKKISNIIASLLLIPPTAIAALLFFLYIKSLF